MPEASTATLGRRRYPASVRAHSHIRPPSRLPIRPLVLVAIALVLIVVSGCGDPEQDAVQQEDEPGVTETTVPEDDSAESPPSQTPDPEPGSTSTPSDPVVAEYVGLDKDEAISLAESQGRPWRITREDDEMFPVTMDYQPDRINFEIDDGSVTAATFG